MPNNCKLVNLNLDSKNGCEGNGHCTCEDECCCFQYLKPLTLEGLFEKNDCEKYEDTLCRAKIIRNALFGAKAAVYNFVNDIDDIQDNLSCDISGNKLELQNVKNQYCATLNTLSAALYSSLRQSHCDKLLVNVDLCKITCTEDEYKSKTQKSQPLTFIHPKSKKPSVLAYIPGVTIELNIETKQMLVKFSEPEFICGFTKHGKAKKSKDFTHSFIIGPPIYNTTQMIMGPENQKLCECFGIDQDEIGNDVEDRFETLFSATDFLDEIINYQDNISCDDMESNNILGFMNYVDKVINSMEQAHRFVVQLSKINNSCN